MERAGGSSLHDALDKVSYGYAPLFQERAQAPQRSSDLTRAEAAPRRAAPFWRVTCTFFYAHAARPDRDERRRASYEVPKVSGSALHVRGDRRP